MEPQNARETLDRLIRDRGDDYAAMSRLIGRNSAYIQQFIKRGTPRKLDETDRRILAEYFGVPETWLAQGDGTPTAPSKENSYTQLTAKAAAPSKAAHDLVLVPRYDVRASAGPGAVQINETAQGHMAFRPTWLRQLTGSRAGQLSMIRVEGDSMVPTLIDGDDILVDRGDAADRVRDGVYVLRSDDVLVVKRLARNPANGRFTIRSDNPAYPVWPDCAAADIHIIGRVIWSGRRIS
jgi:phage repressor protein C with HTH and peptisase S24 domain